MQGAWPTPCTLHTRKMVIKVWCCCWSFWQRDRNEIFEIPAKVFLSVLSQRPPAASKGVLEHRLELTRHLISDAYYLLSSKKTHGPDTPLGDMLLANRCRQQLFYNFLFFTSMRGLAMQPPSTFSFFFHFDYYFDYKGMLEHSRHITRTLKDLCACCWQPVPSRSRFLLMDHEKKRGAPGGRE